MESTNKTASFMPVTGFALLLLAACGRPEGTGGVGGTTPGASGAPAAAAAPTVWEAMIQVMIPRSNTVWELAGNLYNNDGNIDAAQLKPEQWVQLKEAAQAMADSAAALAQAQKPVVAPAGMKILNEGTPGSLGAAEVQAAIDADPQVFRQDAAALVAISKELVAAADAKDGMKTDTLSNQLTEVCGGCHMRFWTPNQ